MKNGKNQNEKEKLFEQVIAKPEKVQKEDTGEIDAKIFYSAINKIEKIRPSDAKTGAEWKFSMMVEGKTAVFQLPNNAIMNSYGAFEDLFKSNFGMYLPYSLTRVPENGETKPWKKFMRFIEQICEEVDPVESIEWIECDIILGRVAGFRVTIDNKMWANKSKGQNALLKKEQGNNVYYLLKPEDIQQLAKDLKLGTTVEKLGGVMNTRGYKRVGNPACRTGPKGNVERAWWFTESCLLEYGLNSDPLQNPISQSTPLQAEGGY